MSDRWYAISMFKRSLKSRVFFGSLFVPVRSFRRQTTQYATQTFSVSSKEEQKKKQLWSNSFVYLMRIVEFLYFVYYIHRLLLLYTFFSLHLSIAISFTAMYLLRFFFRALIRLLFRSFNVFITISTTCIHIDLAHRQWLISLTDWVWVSWNIYTELFGCRAKLFFFW